MAAIEKLDYNQNLIARTLRTRVSESIGLILPSITNPYYPEFVRGVEDQATKENLTLFICNSDRDPDKETKYIKSFLKKSVDGFLIMNPKVSSIELAELKTEKFVVIGIDDNIDSQLNIVNSSAAIGTLLGMELLYSHRHQKIGFLTGGGDTFSDINKLKAYRFFLQDRNLPIREDYIYHGDYTFDAGYLGARQLLELTDPPTAIFGSNDLMAIGALKAAKEMGFKVPRDLSVLGNDDIEMARYLDPALTTIHQPKYELGVESVRMLVKIMNSERSIEGMRKTLPAQVVVRETVDYPRI